MKARRPSDMISFPTAVWENALCGSSSWWYAPMYSEWSVTAMKSKGQARLTAMAAVPPIPQSRSAWAAGTMIVSPRPNL